MNAGELMLRHARVDERVQHLTGEIGKLEAALASNPRLEQARARLEEARASEREVALRLRASEREVEGHRTKMRDRDRELIALRYGADLTARQIAELQGAKTNAIEVALHRALTRLRGQYEDSGEEQGGVRKSQVRR